MFLLQQLHIAPQQPVCDAVDSVLVAKMVEYL